MIQGRDNNMISIGITGGVGSGKSEALAYLKDKYGAVILLADEAARMLEEKGMPCYNSLVKVFGERILGEDGEIDKKRFAEIIFSDKDNVKKVNDIIHPAVKEFILNRMEEEENDGCSLFILEAALLIENGYDEILDELWYIHTTPEVRATRLKESRGYSDEKIRDIMSHQLSDDEFIAGCSRVIENNGTTEELHINIDRCIAEVLKA